MTPQEAYNECKTFFENGGIGELDGVAFNMALNALEKQIPKKPIEETSKTYDGDDIDVVYICPKCSRFICFEQEANQGDFPHCHCGQALDWSDTK